MLDPIKKIRNKRKTYLLSHSQVKESIKSQLQNVGKKLVIEKHFNLYTFILLRKKMEINE